MKKIMKALKVTKRLSNNKGMTLIEILIALTLMVGIGAFIGVNVLEKFHEGRVSSAKIQISNFEAALDDFARDIGRYPTTEEGLEALFEAPAGMKNYRSGGYLKKKEIPVDPWGNEYGYISEGGDTVKILSYGADGEEGGEGKGADITN